MEFGMSRLGHIAYREGTRSPFLQGGGAEMARPREHSEQTLREIDMEVRRIIDEAMESVRSILKKRRKALDAVAKTLIQKEVIDAIELRSIIEANSPSPMIVPGTEADPRPPSERPHAAPTVTEVIIAPPDDNDVGQAS